MSNFLGSRTVVASLLLLLVLSLAYNVVWISAAPAIVEMECKAHFAEVHADAMRRSKEEAWLPAAHLYDYLIRYNPYGADGCLSNGSTDVDWTLPVAALALSWKYRESPDERARITAIDEAEFRREYFAAAHRAGIQLSDSDSGGELAKLERSR